MRQRFLCLALVLTAATAVLTAATACSRADEPTAAAPATPAGTSSAGGERKYLLERVDDAAVVQLYADQFAALPLKEKTLAYHLAQAALAGRDIFYDQKHRHALEMRGVLEAILTHPNGIETPTLSEIERYTKLFWINTGPYNNLTSRKFVLKITPQALATAAQTAEKSGATFPTQSGESLDALLKRLEPMFFDPNVDPIVTNKNPGAGQGHPDRQRQQPLLRRQHGGPQRLHREERTELASGEDERPAGRRGLQDRRPLRKADRRDRPASRSRDSVRQRIDRCRAQGAGAVVSHRRRWRPGEVRHRVGEGQGRVVDTINGFVEVYMDPRGVKGSWEGVVYHVNREKTDRDPEVCRQRAVVRGPHAVRREVPQAERQGHRRQRHRRRHRDRRLRTGDADRHQPAERSEHSRAVRQQVGLARQRERGLRQVAAGDDAQRVRVDAGGGGARGEVRVARRRADDRHARGHRPRVGPAGGRLHGHAAGGDQGALLRARGGPRRSGRPVLPRRSQARRDRHLPGRRPGRDRARRVRVPTRATRWCSCGGFARARRSKKTTCATAR